MSKEIVQKLETSFDCKQRAVRAVRFNGKCYLISITFNISIIFGFLYYRPAILKININVLNAVMAARATRLRNLFITSCRFKNI